jgi:Ca2+:H+ antiporter
LFLKRVLTLLLPAAFFAALSRGDVTSPEAADTIINDTNRTTFLQMSRGLAIILLTVYICSRIYLHNPPGDNNAATIQPNAPMAARNEEENLDTEDPELNQWVCIVMLIITIALMAATAEWVSGYPAIANAIFLIKSISACRQY